MYYFPPQQKPKRWGSFQDIQYSIRKNSEKIYGINSANNICNMPIWESGGDVVRDFSKIASVGAVANMDWAFDSSDAYLKKQASNATGIAIPASVYRQLGTNPFSIILHIKITTDPNGNSIFSTAGIAPDSSDSQHILYQRVWYEALSVLGQSIWVDRYSKAEISSVINASLFRTVVMVRNIAGGTVDVYIDNVKFSTADTGLTCDGASATNWLLMSSYSMTTSDHGAISHFSAVTEALTAEQIALFYQRPWDLYRRVGRTYYSVAAAPSGFQPAWARHSNIILQPGVYS